MLEKRSYTKYQLRYLLGVARALVGNVYFFVNSTKNSNKVRGIKNKILVQWGPALAPGFMLYGVFL